MKWLLAFCRLLSTAKIVNSFCPILSPVWYIVRKVIVLKRWEFNSCTGEGPQYRVANSAFLKADFEILAFLKIKKSETKSGFFWIFSVGKAWLRQSIVWAAYSLQISSDESLGEGWANRVPRATCGRPQRFESPAEAFRKIFKSEISSNSSQLCTVSAKLTWTETCFNFH